MTRAPRTGWTRASLLRRGPLLTATLILIRHGTTADVDRRLSGRAPVPLSAEGRSQCGSMAARVAAWAPDRLVSSPVLRAHETAETIAAATGLAIEADARLAEIDFGEWVGRDFASLHGDPAWTAWNAERANARPPGGETMAEAQVRVVAALADAAARGGTVAMVSHADCLKAVVCHVLGLDLGAMHAFAIDPASVTRLQWGDWGARLLTLNEGGC